MNKTTFILLGVTYYIVSVLIIIIVLNKINKKGKNKYKQEIEELERDKNQIISSDIMSSLQTVEEFVNNDLMQEVYNNLRTRFDVIKKEDIPHITDNLLKLEDLYDSKKYKELNKLLTLKTKLSIKVVDFSRNFGKESAMFAGLNKTTGDYVCIIDADMQQPPSLLPTMVKELDENEEYDVVAYFQEKRIEGKLVSKLKSMFYKTISKMSEVEFVDGASDFRMMRRYVVDSILAMQENNRFSKGIFAWIGFNTKYLPYTPNDRTYGTSSFNMVKLFKYALSGIIAFSIVPLKLATYAGILSSLISFTLKLLISYL